MSKIHNDTELLEAKREADKLNKWIEAAERHGDARFWNSGGADALFRRLEMVEELEAAIEQYEASVKA